jgi:hypothetical protein
MYCTREQLLDFLRSRKTSFAAEFSVTRLGIFGSYARGEARDDSDIDIVVELEKPDLFALIGIKQAVEEAFGARVDVVRLRERMNEVLRRRIDRDAIYV